MKLSLIRFVLILVLILKTSLAFSQNTFLGNVILGSPTTTTIKANIFSANQSGSLYIEYGTESSKYEMRTDVYLLQMGQPLEVALTGLKEDTLHYYRLVFQETSQAKFIPQTEYTFHTARLPGSAFVFAIQGDSHPERAKKQFDETLYTRTLNTAALDKPDFYFAIGDDFSVDTLDAATINSEKVRERYLLQRPYFGLIGKTSPVFLVNGNHEQASMANLDGTANNVAVWAQTARNSLYSQPAPDEFYTGDSENIPNIGLLRDYYAFTWGDVLFVVIDPYWHSSNTVDNAFGSTKTPKGGRDLWDITLGETQYKWFKQTLETSKAKYKFVFTHHVLGTGRGGIELADLYEWGGKDNKGAWLFDKYRPGWEKPIHSVMVDNHVSIFFQGHDHIWVKQELDGIIYQTLPEPADPFYTLYNSDAYLSGDKFSNTGYTRVSVSANNVKVDYVSTFLPKDENANKVSGKSIFSYTLPVGNPTLSVVKSDSGSVVSQPSGIDCGSVCEANFTLGNEIELTATPKVNYVFDGWTGDCTGINCRVKMTGDKKIQAIFSLDKIAPSVLAFSVPSLVNSSTVPITTFIAKDNKNVIGYMLTQTKTTPAVNSSQWRSDIPKTYTFNSSGEKLLYAWAKDEMGNISDPIYSKIIIDTTKPVVSRFVIPAKNTGLTIPINTLTSTDNVAIAGYLISENSTLPNEYSEWKSQKPLSYTTTSAGSKTLYLWVKDTAGNVSATKTAKCVVTNTF